MFESSSSIVSWDWSHCDSWVLDFALGVLLTSFPTEKSLGEGVTGLDVIKGVMSSPSSSSIALLLHGFREVVLSSERGKSSNCMQGLVGLTSFSPEWSDTSDGALFLHLRLLPLPGLGLSGLALLARDWYSCSGMLVLYFLLVLFFSNWPTSASTPTLAPVCPPLWEFLGGDQGP